jgi:hypothetical protein
MSGGAHLVGHRVDDISYARRFVVCDCGAKITTPKREPAFVKEERQALADAFADHRRAHAVRVANKAGG